MSHTYIAAFLSLFEIRTLASTLSGNVALQEVAVVGGLHALTAALLVDLQLYGDIAHALKLRATNEFRLSDRHRLIFCFDCGT